MDEHRLERVNHYLRATSVARIANLKTEAELIPAVASRNNIAIERELKYG